jgi:ATP-dependent 26S proteasome regulatory subunit
MAEDKRKFKFKQYTSFTEMAKSQDQLVLPSSDLCIQTNDGIYQFELEDPDEIIERESIKPGMYNVGYERHRPVLIKADFREAKILEEVVNTTEINTEIDMFFNNLDVYEQLNIEKTRKILMYSEPGMGKTAAIINYCKKFVEQDSQACVINWPTGVVDSDDIVDLLSNRVTFEKCSRLIFIIEDIGGKGNDYSGVKNVDQNLLDLLDGIAHPFTIPTVVLATTNYPQNLIEALVDRPGRFDKVVELKPPSGVDMIKIIEFLTRAELSEQDKKAIYSDKAKGFSIAHIREALIRSKISKVTMEQAINEISNYRKKVKNSFEDKRGMGFD